MLGCQVALCPFPILTFNFALSTAFALLKLSNNNKQTKRINRFSCGFWKILIKTIHKVIHGSCDFSKKNWGPIGLVVLKFIRKEQDRQSTEIYRLIQGTKYRNAQLRNTHIGPFSLKNDALPLNSLFDLLPLQYTDLTHQAVPGLYISRIDWFRNS